jgi:acyl-CoA thioester hydrolase
MGRNETLPVREDFPHSSPIQTRWADNDVYGHINNVVYYAYFDTTINAWLAREGGFDVVQSPVIGLCVESQCRYVAPASYPDTLEAGLKVAHLGKSSVRYELGIFRGDTLCAFGHFVHVFVDREQRKPAEITGKLRDCLGRLRR